MRRMGLVDYWRDTYDWRAHEARLNGFRQFTAPVAGIDLHFIHEEGRGPRPLPLLLSHGWPGSIWEFHKIIPMLTDPARFGGDPHNVKIALGMTRREQLAVAALRGASIAGLLAIQAQALSRMGEGDRALERALEALALARKTRARLWEVEALRSLAPGDRSRAERRLAE